MGNCVVTVHVTGCHHNGLPNDIDQRGAEFVDRLKADGHVVTAASIVSGGEQDLVNPAVRYPLMVDG